MKRFLIQQENGQQPTYEQLSLPISLTQTYTPSGSLANLLALLESGEDSKMQEALSFLKSCDWLKYESLCIWSEKMSKIYSIMTKGKLSATSFPRWMRWGTMSNGRCLTARITEFPITESGYTLLDILEQDVPEKYYLSSEVTARLMGYEEIQLIPLQQDMGQPNQQGRTLLKVNSRRKSSAQIKQIGVRKDYGGQPRTKDRVYDIHGIAPTLTGGARNHEPKIAIPVLTPARKKKRQNGRRFKTVGEEMFTLTAQDVHGVMVWDGAYDGWRIRKLTPRECFRLQGFLDAAFDKAREVNSDTQLYKQAGNAVTVNVAYEIGRRIVTGRN